MSALLEVFRYLEAAERAEAAREYAPRGVLVLDDSRIGELGSVAQHAAIVAAPALPQAGGQALSGGMVSPRTTAGRAAKASSTRFTSLKSSNPTSSPAP